MIKISENTCTAACNFSAQNMTADAGYNHIYTIYELNNLINLINNLISNLSELREQAVTYFPCLRTVRKITMRMVAELSVNNILVIPVRVLPLFYSIAYNSREIGRITRRMVAELPVNHILVISVQMLRLFYFSSYISRAIGHIARQNFMDCGNLRIPSRRFSIFLKNHWRFSIPLRNRRMFSLINQHLEIII
jgi:hypothetical protein